MLKTVIVALILCIIEILVIVIAGPIADLTVVLRFLPEDVRLAAKNHPKPSKGKQITAHLLLVLFLAAMLGGIGMKLDRVRNCGEKFHMYDLIRE